MPTMSIHRRVPSCTSDVVRLRPTEKPGKAGGTFRGRAEARKDRAGLAVPAGRRLPLALAAAEAAARMRPHAFFL
ncbi:hypothetical protein Emed_001438 [Eimeria media]